LLARLSLHDSGNPDARAAAPFELPYTLELPQAEIDTWRQHRDLLKASQRTCKFISEQAEADASFNKEITAIGCDVYLNTLKRLDNEAQRWIKAILAGKN
jgi:hypothetical protein